jgi:hypothetical protein
MHRLPTRRVALLVLLLVGVLLPAATTSAAEPRRVVVTGQVTDDDGRSLAGASVTLSGSGLDATGERPSVFRQTETDEHGRYRLTDVFVPAVEPFWESGAAELRVEAADHVGTRRSVLAELRSGLGAGTVVLDQRLPARSATIRGRVSVRGAALGPATVTAANPDGTVRFSTDTAADGSYELRLSGGHWRVTGESRFGLTTRWPDLPMGRDDAPDLVVQRGAVRDGVDLSLRARLPGPGIDEYGLLHRGYDPAQENAAPVTYPRDSYHSVLSPLGPRLDIAVSPFHEPSVARNLQPGELLTFGNVAGPGMLVTVGLRNTGDDLVFLKGLRLEGGDRLAAFSCHTDLLSPCDVQRVPPGRTITLRLGILFADYRFRYGTTLVVPDVGLRIPLALRNVMPPGWDPAKERRVPADWADHAPPEQLALAVLANGGRPFALGPSAKAMAAGKTAEQATPGGPTAVAKGNSTAPAGTGPAASPRKRLGKPSLSRTRLSARFPLAGRATIRIDREVAPKGRDGRPARFRTVARVSLRAARPGIRRARVRRLAPGRYRMRVQAWIGGAPLDARTVTVRVGR